MLGWGLDTARFLVQLSFVAQDVNWLFCLSQPSAPHEGDIEGLCFSEARSRISLTRPSIQKIIKGLEDCISSQGLQEHQQDSFAFHLVLLLG